MAMGGGTQAHAMMCPTEDFPARACPLNPTGARRDRKAWTGWLLVGVLMGSVLLTAGCGDARKAFGLSRNAPDEFQVYKRQPLSMPPDFSLRPPVPGAPRPQSEETKERAAEVLLSSEDQNAGDGYESLAGGLPSLGGPPGLGSTAASSGSATGGRSLFASGSSERRARASGTKSDSEVALLRRVGAQNAVAGIRDIVDRETSTLVAANQSIIDDLLFWKDPKDVHTVLPANEEARRLALQRQEEVRARVNRNEFDPRPTTVAREPRPASNVTETETGETDVGETDAGKSGGASDARVGASADGGAESAEQERTAITVGRPATPKATREAARTAVRSAQRRQVIPPKPAPVPVPTDEPAETAFQPGQATASVSFGESGGGDSGTGGAPKTERQAQAAETDAGAAATDATDAEWSTPFGGTF